MLSLRNLVELVKTLVSLKESTEFDPKEQDCLNQASSNELDIPMPNEELPEILNFLSKLDPDNHSFLILIIRRKLATLISLKNYTLLHLASLAGDVILTKAICDAYTTPEDYLRFVKKKTEFGATALFLARNGAVAEILLSPFQEQKELRQYVTQHCQEETILQRSLRQNNLTLISVILNRLEANQQIEFVMHRVDPPRDKTALYLSVELGRTPFVQALITDLKTPEAKKNYILQSAYYGKTVLYLAAERNDNETVSVLLRFFSIQEQKNYILESSFLGKNIMDLSLNTALKEQLRTVIEQANIASTHLVVTSTNTSAQSNKGSLPFNFHRTRHFS